jgi:hypothetical protein
VNEGTRPNQALQRTAAGRLGCNRRVSWSPSLSLGRWADHAIPSKVGGSRSGFRSSFAR